MLPVKDPAETIVVTFDFSSAITGTIPSIIDVTATVYSGGADANPSAILYGSPQIQVNKVLQSITGGVSGVQYDLRCRVNAPDGASKLVAADVLPVLSF